MDPVEPTSTLAMTVELFVMNQIFASLYTDANNGSSSYIYSARVYQPLCLNFFTMLNILLKMSKNKLHD